MRILVRAPPRGRPPALRRALCQAAAAPAKEAAPQEGYTNFQKACAAVATVGAVSSASFAYTIYRVTSDREFRLWLHRDVRPVATYLEEFMHEYMPQTAKALRINEEALVDGVAVPPDPIVMRSSLNLGAAAAVPQVTDTGKRFFGRLEQEPDGGESAPRPTPAPLPGPSAIGVPMPAQPRRVYRTAEEMHVTMAEEAAAIAPDEEEEGGGVPSMYLFDPDARGAATPGEACSAGVPEWWRIRARAFRRARP